YRQHKVAVVSARVVIGFYAVVLGADFLAYADPNASEAQRSLMPPQRVYLFDGWRVAPYVHGFKGVADTQSFKRVYRSDPEQRVRIRFFAEGFEYRFFGLIPTTRHLIGVDGGLDASKTIFLLGTDVQGRDLWSRLMYGTRISLTIGLLGVSASLVLGVVLGGISGFYGGMIDTVIQRTIEILRSIPTIPLPLPAMIITETALSFLGLGLRPPAISWGVLLQQAQNVQTVAISPWLMLTAIPVIIAVMAFNFLGDGLRDAADPYGR